MIPLKDNIPTLRFPIVTVVLIVINVVVFAWQFSLSDEVATAELAAVGISERDQANFEYGAIPARITHPGDQCAIGVTPTTPERATLSANGTPAQHVFVCGPEESLDGESGGLIAFAQIDGAFWMLTLLTSMFMHGGLLHLGGNMLFLWIFGNNVEDSMGRARFVGFYLLAGLIAVYAQALLDTSSATPTIGASGAVAGVLGAYAVLYPRARVVSIVIIIFFFTLVEIPAAILLGIWFGLQFLPAAGQLATPDVAGGVAYFAHVGGFIFGLLAIRLFARSRDPDQPPSPYPVEV